MRAYIINLEKSINRRENMCEVLSGIKNLDFEFINAVDGRELSEAEIDKKFNKSESERRYHKEIQLGEIGCTLSHQKCYRKLMESDDECVLIFEDDIYLNVDKKEIEKVFQIAEEQLDNEVPSIILFSGWNYYLKRKKISEKYYLTKVTDGYLAHAYLINRLAAQLMIEERPWMLADNWKYVIKKGVIVKGLIPHCINQNGDIKSDITSSTDRFKFKSGILQMIVRRSIHLVYKLFGYYEKADKDYIC